MRVAVEPRAWWAALGGPNAISLWSWLVTTGIAALVSIAYEIPVFDYRLWQRLGLVLITQVALIPIFLISYLLLRRLPRSMPSVGLAIFMLIGVARGLIITLLAPHIEPLARSDLQFQMLVGITYALLSLPFIAVVVDSLRRHRALQARVLAAQESWHKALRETEDRFDRDYALYRQRVESEVIGRVITLTDDLASIARDAKTSGAVAAAEELRRLSAEVVRPLSHELILDATPARVEPTSFPAPPPLLGLRDVLADASRSPTAGHWVVCAAMAFLSAVGLSSMAPVTFVAVNIVWNLVVFGLAPMAVIAASRHWWNRASVSAAWLASVMLWVCLSVLAVTGTALLGGLMAGSAVLYWSAGAFYVLISFATVIAWTGFRRLRQLDAAYLALLHEQEEMATAVLARLDRNRRHLGLVLHGSVQSSLAKAARNLEDWSEEMDELSLPEVLAEVREALDAAMKSVDLDPPTDASLTSVLHERINLWADSVTCSLTVSADAEVLDDAVLVEQLGDITGEAITNAVIHGQADHVDVAVETSGGAIVLRVSDNGNGLRDTSPAGGGIGHLIRSGCLWTLERERDRTVLTVRIRMSREWTLPARSVK